MDSLEFQPSRSTRGRAGGQRARSPAPGAGSRRHARKEGGRYPGAPRAEPGCRASMRRLLSEEGQHPPWSGQAPGPLPLLRGWATHREVTARGRGAAAPAGSLRTRFTRRGAGARKPRAAPPHPHPAQAAHPRGHRPQAAAPGLEWGGRRMRRYWVPAPPPRRSGR